MSNKEKGTDYEKLVNPLIKAFVSHNNYTITRHEGGDQFTIIGKSGCAHQIDVYFECESNNMTPKRIIIECKDHGASISIGRVRDFFAVQHDIGDVEAWFVSRNGFTSMSKKFAKYYGIKLITLDNSRITAKSNIPKPLLCWENFALDGNLIDGDNRKDGVFVNISTGEELTLSEFLDMFYDTGKLPIRSKNKTIKLKGKWRYKTYDCEIRFKEFTLYYHLIKHSPAVFTASLKNKYILNANLETR